MERPRDASLNPTHRGNHCGAKIGGADVHSTLRDRLCPGPTRQSARPSQALLESLGRERVRASKTALRAWRFRPPTFADGTGSSQRARLRWANEGPRGVGSTPSSYQGDSTLNSSLIHLENTSKPQGRVCGRQRNRDGEHGVMRRQRQRELKSAVSEFVSNCAPGPYKVH